MEFAKRELEKYGWAEGQGLGKNEDGIVKALKPKLKFDNAGLGHDISEEYNDQWWQKLYDETSKNIITEEGTNGVIIKTKKPENHKKKKTGKLNLDSQCGKYKGFIKTSNLNGAKEKRLSKCEFDNELNPSGCDNIKNGITNLLDEELLKVCGGRTAHKGARHGLKMSAKLARIEEQEKNQMRSAVNVHLNENKIKVIEVSKKKKKKKLK